MSIGGIRVHILINESFSLKDKRKILNSLKQKMINNFKVSISEVSENDLWNKSVLDVAIAAKDEYNLNDKINKIKKFLMEQNSIEILKINKIYGAKEIESF